MRENNICTSVRTTTTSRWNEWDEEREEIEVLELEVRFCKKTFLNDLTDEEIKCIICQDESEYSISDTVIERYGNGGLIIRCYTLDKYYFIEPYETVNKFKQYVLNGILLYMMTKVVL